VITPLNEINPKYPKYVLAPSPPFNPIFRHTPAVAGESAASSRHSLDVCYLLRDKNSIKITNP
jgi:hypothetical protein